VKRTVISPLQTLLGTIVIGGAVFCIGWLQTGLLTAPSVVDSLFLSFPFALGIVTVRAAFRPIRPVLFVFLHCALAILVLFAVAIVPEEPGSMERRVAREIPDAPVTVWEDDEVWYAHERSGRAYRSIVAARRGSLLPSERPRLRFSPRRSIPIEQTVPGFETGIDAARSQPDAVFERIRGDVGTMQNTLIGMIDGTYRDSHRLSESVRKWIPPVLWERWYSIAFLAAWCLALACTWTAGRATRWPLFNLLCALAYIRFLFAVPRLVTDLLAVEFVGRAVPEAVQRSGDLIALVFVVCIAGVVAWLLPAVDRREART
jgi:hypothetical protein